MSDAAAGICRLKCFCLCFCWTFRAKPEPRIPWKEQTPGLTSCRRGVERQAGHRWPAWRCGPHGGGRCLQPSPWGRRQPHPSRTRCCAPPGLLTGWKGPAPQGELPVHRGEQVIHMYIRSMCTYIHTLYHSHVTHTCVHRHTLNTPMQCTKEYHTQRTYICDTHARAYTNARGTYTYVTRAQAIHMHTHMEHVCMMHTHRHRLHDV